MKRILFASLAVFAGLGGVLGLRYLQVRIIPPFISEASTFVLSPPSRALSGTLGETTGTVSIYLRENTAYVEASPAATIRQGESLATGRDSSVGVSVGNALALAMEESAEVTFVHLIPDSMVLRQKSGRITYHVTNGEHPIAIRALHTLISMTRGSTIINVVDTDISVRVLEGKTTIALVDHDNNTQVLYVSEGSIARIDDTAREVTILP